MRNPEKLTTLGCEIADDNSNKGGNGLPFYHDRLQKNTRPANDVMHALSITGCKRQGHIQFNTEIAAHVVYTHSAGDQVFRCIF